MAETGKSRVREVEAALQLRAVSRQFGIADAGICSGVGMA